MTSAGTVALVALAGFALFGTASAALEMDPETVADAALRTISFSPWGAVMLWVALSVRKAIYSLTTRWDAFLALLQVNADALKGLSDAQKEATAHSRESRPNTEPHLEPPRGRSKSQSRGS